MSRFFTKSHEWIDFDATTKTAAVGISNYAQQQLGEIIHVEFPVIGHTYERNDSVCVIESVKIAGDIYTPVAGKITAYNKSAEENPCLINDEAETTWLFKITYTAIPTELLTPEQYQKIIE